MKNLIYLLIIVFYFAAVKNTFAQFDLLDKVKEKVEEKISDKAAEAVDGKDEKPADEEQQQNATEQAPTKDEKPVTKETLKTYSKFDFVPGDKIVYYDDFSQDAIGDFPALWNTNGSGEVQTTNIYPGNWFSMTKNGWYMPDPFVELPENFTIQYDLVVQIDPEDNTNNFETGIYIYEVNPDVHDEGGIVPGFAGIKLWFGQWSASWGNYVDGAYILDGNTSLKEWHRGDIVKISICGQKQRIRVYMNENKIFDIPKGLPANHKFNRLCFIPYTGIPMIANLRVAAGAPDMRNKLLTDGKLVTHGILFDVNSDKIKPESYGTLKEIAKVLQENPSVRVKIIGHTDSDGSDAANLELSKKRSESVKNSLKSEFGVDASRMETDGKGEVEPISDNNTPAGKANNRRVEFIKL